MASLQFTEARIPGAYLITPQPSTDDRGFFARLWSREDFATLGLMTEVAQCNGAFTARRGTIRGLHYQLPPHQEVKMLRCVRGTIFDVIVDLRVTSPTYRRWMGTTLSAAGGQMIYVPPGCAHGYLTLEDACEIFYLVSHPYHPDAERGMRWDDPSIAIEWPLTDNLTISEKDRAWPNL